MRVPRGEGGHRAGGAAGRSGGAGGRVAVPWRGSGRARRQGRHGIPGRGRGQPGIAVLRRRAGERRRRRRPRPRPRAGRRAGQGPRTLRARRYQSDGPRAARAHRGQVRRAVLRAAPAAGDRRLDREPRRAARTRAERRHAPVHVSRIRRSRQVRALARRQQSRGGARRARAVAARQHVAEGVRLVRTPQIRSTFRRSQR